MLSRVLWGWMLIEVVVFGALGRLALGWSWPATLALVLGAMLAVRALMMAVTWFMAWRWLSPAPALLAHEQKQAGLFHRASSSFIRPLFRVRHRDLNVCFSRFVRAR